jgi:transposase
MMLWTAPPDGGCCRDTVTAIGVDIVKSVVQVHGINAWGEPVVRWQLKRRQVAAFFEKLEPFLIGIEACASSHYWARELMALGHDLRLMPPAYVKPYVKRHKNYAMDAEAICGAVLRPNMRFVPVKSPEQQAGLTPHRTRHLFIRQRTATINTIRAFLAEFGVVALVGRKGLDELLKLIAEGEDSRVPPQPRKCLVALSIQFGALQGQMRILDRRILAWQRTNELAKRLGALPGVGHALATALVASVAGPNAFRSGRDFSACAQAELDRRQSQAGQCEQAGRPVPLQFVYGRRSLSDQIRQDAWYRASAVARQAD